MIRAISCFRGPTAPGFRFLFLRFLLLLLLELAPTLAQGADSSRTIAAVLREPLPAEELLLSSTEGEWVIAGPTFSYHVQKGTGVLSSLQVRSDHEVLFSGSSLEIQLDGVRASADLVCTQAVVVTQITHQVVLRCQGALRLPPGTPDVDCTLLHAFFDDGVVVTTVTLTPLKELAVQKGLDVRLQAQGPFTHYLHKRRDEHGESAVRGLLPTAGQAVRFSTLTSCLQVFGQRAGLALFTDSGAVHLSRTNLETAAAEVNESEQQGAGVRLSQAVLRIAPGDKPYVLKAGENFTFRVGVSVTPNRLAPPRLHDLRMFAWIGDGKFPYPTNEEIEAAAQNGYTVFQMHRLGTPGEPRPPVEELQRVIRKVHETGMLFLWTENADLMYDGAPGVQELKARDQFSRWQGFNYGGRYKASMDPYCDLVATCLASPNGLAEYRLATIKRMLDRYEVDGIYLDDNLAYPNCTLWREHGHPQPVYDCLIELHETNWRRRQLLRGRCPHVVLVSHNTRALVQPVICDFDAVLYGEGYSFGSLENYWDYYRPVNGMPAQGMIWPGGQDPVRCVAAVAYTYDLLTGGGQYCYIDWRLFAKKFPHAAGVTDTEHVYVQAYNLAQYYFGLYESKAHCFADSTNLFGTTSPLTYATIYQNQVWGDWLVAVGNMAEERRQTTLEFRDAKALGVTPDSDYLVFDVVRHRAKLRKVGDLDRAFQDIWLPAQGLRLCYVRRLPSDGIMHLWGGKRLSEEWSPSARKLTVKIQGPSGLEETVCFAGKRPGVAHIMVNGHRAEFYFDPKQGLIHGTVTFGPSPLTLEVFTTPAGDHILPQRAVPATPLAKVL